MPGRPGGILSLPQPVSGSMRRAQDASTGRIAWQRASTRSFNWSGPAPSRGRGPLRPLWNGRRRRCESCVSQRSPTSTCNSATARSWRIEPRSRCPSSTKKTESDGALIAARPGSYPAEAVWLSRRSVPIIAGLPAGIPAGQSLESSLRTPRPRDSRSPPGPHLTPP